MAFFYEDVLSALETAGVRFVLVGGTAVILHGVPRTTADLDIVPDLDAKNLLKLVEVLEGLGFRPRAPVPARELADPTKRSEWSLDKGMKAFSFYRPTRALDAVDVLFDSPISFAELATQAVELKADGLTIRIARPEDLIRMKTHAGRPQDLADIDALTRLLEARSRG